MDSSENVASIKFICEICEKIFSPHDYKKKHMLHVHGEQKKCVCNVCNKVFQYHHHLKYHITKIHNGEPFTESKSLKKNMKTIHEGRNDLDYECDACGKSLISSVSLKRHIKTVHERQINYKCDSCGKSFTESGSLKKHIRTVHEGQRNPILNRDAWINISKLSMKDK